MSSTTILSYLSGLATNNNWEWYHAHTAAKGKLPVSVGYYLMIKPGNQSFLGGGLFADVFKDATAMVRGETNPVADHCTSYQTTLKRTG